MGCGESLGVCVVVCEWCWREREARRKKRIRKKEGERNGKDRMIERIMNCYLNDLKVKRSFKKHSDNHSKEGEERKRSRENVFPYKHTTKKSENK